MFRLKKKKAQTALEYSLLIFAIIAALVAMRHFFIGAQKGRLFKDLKDVGDQFDPSEGYAISWTNEGVGQTQSHEYVTEGGASTSVVENTGSYVESSGSETWGEGADLPE